MSEHIFYRLYTAPETGADVLMCAKCGKRLNLPYKGARLFSKDDCDGNSNYLKEIFWIQDEHSGSNEYFRKKENEIPYRS